MFSSAVRPLELLCIRKISADFHYYKHSFKYLPQYLKNELSNIAGQREHLLEDMDVLEGLLNAQTEMLIMVNCHVTDRMMEPVKVCRNLKMIKIGSCASVTTEALCNLFPYLKDLEHFSAQNCPGVNDLAIESLAYHCPRISIVDVSNCKDIGDKSMFNLADKPLIALNVAGTQVTDLGMTYIVFGKAKETLREVNLDHCEITDKSIELIIHFCKCLFVFSFKNNKFSGMAQEYVMNNLKYYSRHHKDGQIYIKTSMNSPIYY